MAISHGSFVWYELMTTDAAAAEAFYRDVVGWKTRDAGMPGMAYTLLEVAGAPVAGLMTLPAEAAQSGARPGWIGYVAVDDVDAAAKSFAAAGGTIYRAPDDIPGIGRFAVAADPQGAVICLFRGSGDMGPPAPPAGTPGTIGWHELMATDWQPAFDFYAAQFGWTKAEAHDMGPMGLYQLFAKDGETVGGMMTKPAEVPVAYWGYYFNTEAIDAAAARVTAAGGKILFGPMEVPGGSWVVQGLDPQGAVFALVAPKR